MYLLITEGVSDFHITSERHAVELFSVQLFYIA